MKTEWTIHELAEAFGIVTLNGNPHVQLLSSLLAKANSKNEYYEVRPVYLKDKGITIQQKFYKSEASNYILNIIGGYSCSKEHQIKIDGKFYSFKFIPV